MRLTSSGHDLEHLEGPVSLVHFFNGTWAWGENGDHQGVQNGWANPVHTNSQGEERTSAEWLYGEIKSSINWGTKTSLLWCPAGNTPDGHFTLNQWHTMEPHQRKAIQEVLPRIIEEHPDHRFLVFQSIAWDKASHSTLSSRGPDGKIGFLDMDLKADREAVDSNTKPWVKLVGKDHMGFVWDASSGHRELFYHIREHVYDITGAPSMMESWPANQTEGRPELDALAVDEWPCFTLEDYIRPGVRWPADISKYNRENLFVIFFRWPNAENRAEIKQRIADTLAAGVSVVAGNVKIREIITELTPDELDPCAAAHGIITELKAQNQVQQVAIIKLISMLRG